MASDKQSAPREYLKVCREDLREARTSGDKIQIALSTANLGFALFRLRKFKEGLSSFDEALEIAARQEDPQVQAQVLGQNVGFSGK